MFTTIGIWFVVGFVLGGYLVWLWNPWDDEGIVRGLIGLVGGMILFFGPGLIFYLGWSLFTREGRKILTRMGRIEEAHKRRVAIEFNKAWMRNNKKFIKKNNKRIDREVKRLSRRHGDYWDGEWHTDYY